MIGSTHIRLPLSLTMILSLCLVAPAKQLTDFSSLESVVSDELKVTKTPGVCVAVISGDRVLFVKGFGVANIETGLPVTPELLFHIGSATKMLTAAALVALAGDGRIDLKAPIGNYLKGLSPKVSRITAHQLLSQTSGLKDMPGDYGTHEETALAAFARSLRDDDRMDDSGAFFSYSNPGFALAGAVVEEVGGKPFADVMDERLFKPLGMNHTMFRPTMALTYPHAVGHKVSAGQKPVVARPDGDDTRIWPAGYAYTTIKDFSRLVIALLNRGKLEEHQLLAPSVVTQLLAPHAEIPTNRFVNWRYTYGLFVHDYRGLRVVEHPGSLPGFETYITMVPERRFAVLVFANLEGARFEKTIDKAMELMLTPGPKPESRQKAALPMGEAELQSYVGTYTNRWSLELFVRQNKLYLKRFDQELPVTKIGDNRFSVTPPGTAGTQEFTIKPGPDGQPEFIQMFIWTFKKATKT